MISETRFIEYLIIGAHTTAWLALVLVYVLGIPVSMLTSISPQLLVIALPFVYLLGMLFDSLVQFLLEPLRRLVRKRAFDYKTGKYFDELIAFKSSDLYDAYEARVRRVRVIAASIFNWPLLGLALLLNLGMALSTQTLSVALLSAALCALSVISWRVLYYRAYKFRKNACDIIAAYAAAADRA